MPTTTFGLTCDDTAWIEIADGITYKTIGFQGGQALPINIGIGATSAGLGEDNTIIIGGIMERSIVLDITSTDKVFARCFGGSARLRGFKVAV